MSILLLSALYYNKNINLTKNFFHHLLNLLSVLSITEK